MTSIESVEVTSLKQSQYLKAILFNIFKGFEK
jgi:hypothetical protein